MTVKAPVLVIEPIHPRADPSSGIGVATINYRTKTATLRCIESLRQSEVPPDWLYILDNSELEDGLEAALRLLPPFPHTRIAYYRSQKNLGFAEGSNVLIDRLLESVDCEFVLFLNNDAVALPRLLGELKKALVKHPNAGLAGPRVHKLNDPEQIDSLGIVLYKSLMPADRYSTDEPYLGPSGGCAMATRFCLEKLKQTATYFFDPKLFCYCEDTDLVIRANILGFEPVFLDQILALHEGQASTNTQFGDFIAFHGLRNTIWVIQKLIPTRLLIRFGALHFIAVLLSVTHHILRFRLRLVARIISSCLLGLVDAHEDRIRILANAETSILLEQKIAPRFYRRGYFVAALRRLIQK